MAWRGRSFGVERPARRIFPAFSPSTTTPSRNTTAIWNDVLVDLENRRQWWRGRTEAGFPVLVAVEGDAVLGYASYGPFRAFDGYRQTVEHSVYVAEGARRRGVGERAASGARGARRGAPACT